MEKMRNSRTGLDMYPQSSYDIWERSNAVALQRKERSSCIDVPLYSLGLLGEETSHTCAALSRVYVLFWVSYL